VTPPDGRPAVAFDVIGTLFSLDRPREALIELGAPPAALALWFAQTLSDAFAWSHAGRYRPLKDVLDAALPRTLAQVGVEAGPDRLAGVVATFGELDPQPGAEEAVSMLGEAGWHLMTLTMGSVESIDTLLTRAGMRQHFEELLSCDAVAKTKPHPDVYAMARDRAAGELWMFAAHAWDIAGASAAGLRTVYVTALEKRYLAIYPEPDIRADTLTEGASALLEQGS
jgi:2-haloacid dehalogenase